MGKACYSLCLLVLSVCGAFAQSQVLTADAGPDHAFCDTGYVTLGGAPTAKGGASPYHYQWFPKAPLNFDTIPNPVAYITSNVTFTVIIRDKNGATATDQAVMTLNTYTINAGPDTTIKQGQTITLHGTAAGATQVIWMPSVYNIYNQTTTSPDIFPTVTTTYTFVATYPGGCTLADYVTVTVESSSELYFFNTFTPNGDGANDYFVIGNIEKYPDNVLEIYNRYGQKIFTKTSYKNEWDGKYLNQEVPSGTYFYILDTKSDKGGKYHGQVTIVR